MNEIERAIEYLEPISKHPTMTGAYCEHLKVAIEALHEKAEREKGCWACREVYEVGFVNLGSRIYLERDETGYVISDRFDNTVEAYCCPMCGKSLKEENHDG